MPAGFQLKSFTDLTPMEFENFAFDVLSAAGVQNLVWRTPGPDGGRDIEGTVRVVDFAGFAHEQVWYFECKRYSSSLDWPLVHGKIAYADAHDADYLLIVTNSSPSPNCETQIARWNKKRRRPLVRFWRGYELSGLADSFPAIAAKYGLRIAPPPKLTEFLEFASEISKIAQVTYATNTLGGNSESPVECAAALAELFALRCDDMAGYGRFMPLGKEITNERFSWLDGDAPKGWVFDTATRAVIASIRYVVGAQRLQIVQDGEGLRLTSTGSRIPLSSSAKALLSNVALWADIEVLARDSDFIIRRRVA